VNGNIPIWVGGHWPNPAPFARAAHYDGVVPRKQGEEHGGFLSVEDFIAIRAAIGRDDDDFAYVVSGSTKSPTDTAAIGAWQAAGATWWLEALHPWGGGAESMRDRVRAGPPTL
jgi:hypothetical protein